MRSCLTQGAPRWFLAALGLALSLAHCGPRTVDAVDLGQTADGGTPLMWPNPTHGANSDPWIAANHDNIVQMRPNLLVLDFYNAWPADSQELLARVKSRMDALADASRYHAYSDSSAQNFLAYNLVEVVDLTDSSPPAQWMLPSSTKLPVDTTTGAFDMNRLFGTSFAAYFGGQTLCQLFESGVVNEVWILSGEGNPPRRPPLLAESKQVYDAQNRAIPGVFNASAGYEPFTAPACKVTVRVGSVDPTRGVDCDLVPRWLGVENTLPAIPYLATNAVDFFNDDFKARDGAPFDSWPDLLSRGPAGWCGGPSNACIDYPTPSSAAGSLPDGTAWTMTPFLQGCGSTHFPPNAHYSWDYLDTQAVQCRCEHYAMHDGLAGGDITNAYTSGTVAGYTNQYGALFANGGCGAGWQIYLPQSMPGLHNQAFAADGTPMKNWWPFLFY